MSLAVVDIGVDYLDEKRAYILSLMGLNETNAYMTEKITNFLENYLGTSGSFEDGLAHMDLEDDAGPAARYRGHKYMSQLVRVPALLASTRY